MRVFGFQFDIAWENPDESFRQVEAGLNEAQAAGADLFVLPEMFATGFSMRAEALVAKQSRIEAWLAAKAREYRLHILAGLVGRGPERPKNYAVLFDREGHEQLRYAKLHPFSLAAEHEHYDGGEELSTVVVEGLRVTPLICYDLRFPEPFRARAAETDLFVVIANWPERRALAWQTLTRARAIENQAWLLAVNRCGEDGNGVAHRGDSALFDPFGETVMSCVDQSGLVGGHVDAEAVSRARQGFSFLADRRPKLYKRLERP